MIKNNKSKITGLFLKGWQSIIGPQFFDLNGLVFLYGPNSAGKSSLIDALKIIKYAVGENDTQYTIGYHLRNNSNESSPNGTAIGVEFRVGNLDYEFVNDVKIWRQLENSQGDKSHLDFFKKVKNKRIQVEFSDNFETLKIAIENSPLMEIRGLDPLYYTYAHARSNDAEDPDEDCIYCKLVIHKKNPFVNMLFDGALDLTEGRFSKRPSYMNQERSYHHDLFVEETDNDLIINGISFDPETRHQEHYVCVSYDVEKILFSECPPNFPTRLEEQTNEQQIIYKMFHTESEYFEKSMRDRSSLYWELVSVAKDVNLFVKGIFFHLRDAILMSYVKADRSMLSSKFPMYFTECSILKDVLSIKGLDENLSSYAGSAAEEFINVYGGPLSDADFVGLAIKKYMPSLKNYEIFPVKVIARDADEAKAQETSCNIVFLKLKDKSGKILGFEDVGSGFSFVLPVLTALWNSRISFIEQPELHLHPKAQCEIGDVLIAAKNGGSNSIIESHSEHLLLRVLRRIRENSKGYPLGDDLKINNSEVNIYYFDPMPDGNTKIKKIRIDRHGELLDLWPNGFFSEREGELFS